MSNGNGCGVRLPDEEKLSNTTNTAFASNLGNSHCFVRVMDVLLANETWDDLVDCEFEHLLYGATLKQKSKGCARATQKQGILARCHTTFDL